MRQQQLRSVASVALCCVHAIITLPGAAAAAHTPLPLLKAPPMFVDASKISTTLSRGCWKLTGQQHLRQHRRAMHPRLRC